MKRNTTSQGRISSRGAWVGLSAVGIAIAGLTGMGCSSLGKAELRERVLGIQKNHVIREAGLSEGRLTWAGPQGEEELPFLYLDAKSPNPLAAERRPVVLVHGTPSTLTSWSRLIYGTNESPGLLAERDVIAIEVVGHGFAPGSTRPRGFDDCASFVAAAVRALDIGPVHMAGSSYGGEFVWRCAADNPDLFTSVVLFDASGYERREQDWLSEETAMRENPLAGIGWMVNSLDRVTSALEPHFETVPDGYAEEFFLVCENKQNWKVMIDLARDENGTRSGDIAGIQTPTLLVWGAEDLAYPPEVYASRFDADLPNSELLVLPDTGHYPFEERPNQVLEAMGSFFLRAEAEAAAR